MGKTRIIAETGAGQHGVATATACALMGMPCTVYMGSEDIERQALNAFRMKMLGTTVAAVDSGARTLKDAINEAMRDWVTNVATTHYCVGSAIGPHPFPTIVRDFQAVIGREARAQLLEQAGQLPSVVVACVGGGSNAIGMFHAFVPDDGTGGGDASSGGGGGSGSAAGSGSGAGRRVRLVGVEAGGSGMLTKKHSSTLAAGSVGVLHGTKTFLLQDPHGQITETHSISAGLDYPGVGPEHAHLKATGRADYVSVTDAEALEGLKLLSRHEGIIPALESAHAVYYGLEAARALPPTEDVVVCVSGRGDKDMGTVAKAWGIDLH